MKYIRTKDGIYESDKVILSIPPMHSKRIDIKGADTIEELCDEFVMFQDQNNFVITSDLDIVLQHCFVNDKAKGYGAIWTDKGLIYVAKMNEKGELELL